MTSHRTKRYAAGTLFFVTLIILLLVVFSQWHRPQTACCWYYDDPVCAGDREYQARCEVTPDDNPTP